MFFNETLALLQDEPHALSPCPPGTAGLDILAGVGQAVRAISLGMPLFRQRELRSAWVAWAGGEVAPGPRDKPNRRAKDVANKRKRLCLRAWDAFRPLCNLDDDDVSSQLKTSGGAETASAGSLVFYSEETTNGPQREPLFVPLFFCRIDRASKLPIMSTLCVAGGTASSSSSSSLPTDEKGSSRHQFTITAAVLVGDLLGCRCPTRSVPEVAEVVAIHRKAVRTEQQAPGDSEGATPNADTGAATTAEGLVEVAVLSKAAAHSIHGGLVHDSRAVGRSAATLKPRANSLRAVAPRYCVSVAELSGVDVVRPLSSHGQGNGQGNSQGTVPAFVLPGADPSAALAFLKQRASEDAQRRKALAARVGGADDEGSQRRRLLDAMRAREVRCRCEALRLLRLLDGRRASESVGSWVEVGQALCAASPDLEPEWTAWTLQHGRKHYPSVFVTAPGTADAAAAADSSPTSLRRDHRKPPLLAEEACRERWRVSFRPPTSIDFGNLLPAADHTGTVAAAAHRFVDDRDHGGGSGRQQVLQFVDPLDGSALTSQATRVQDSAPAGGSSGLVASLPTPLGLPTPAQQQAKVTTSSLAAEASFEVRCEVRVGDWVSCRSKVALRFVRVVGMALHKPRNHGGSDQQQQQQRQRPWYPSLTVAKTVSSAALTRRDVPRHFSAPPVTQIRDSSTAAAASKNANDGSGRLRKGAEQAENEMEEEWDDLGMLWGAWVWRANEDDNTGLLFRLPIPDMEKAGVGVLERLVDEDEVALGAQEEALKAQQAKDPRKAMAYYAPHKLTEGDSQFRTVMGPAPKVVLARRGEDSLTIGWKKQGLGVGIGSAGAGGVAGNGDLGNGDLTDALVEVLVRVLRCDSDGGGGGGGGGSQKAKSSAMDGGAGSGEVEYASSVWRGRPDNSFAHLLAAAEGSGGGGGGGGGGQAGVGKGSNPKAKPKASLSASLLKKGLTLTPASSQPFLELGGSRLVNSGSGGGASRKRVVEEWRPIYRGPKNGCHVSQLSAGRTYSFRVRLGLFGRFTHCRFSTIPQPPPPPLVRKWTPVPRPNRDPRPTRERMLELVVGGAKAWHCSHSAEAASDLRPYYNDIVPAQPQQRQQQQQQQAQRRGLAKNFTLSGVSDGGDCGVVKNSNNSASAERGACRFGSTSARFQTHTKGGAMNGGGLHTKNQNRRFAQASSSSTMPTSGEGQQQVTKSQRVTTLPSGWTYVVECHELSAAHVLALEEDLLDVLAGGADDFFARHPLPENGDDNDDGGDDQGGGKASAKKTGGNRSSSSSSSSSGGGDGLLKQHWVEVGRTRSTVAHVSGLVFQEEEEEEEDAVRGSNGRAASSGGGNDAGLAGGGGADDGWALSAREKRLRANRKRFEGGYLFSRSTAADDEGGADAETAGKTLLAATAAGGSVHEEGVLAAAAAAATAAARRHVYVFRTRVESMEDPLIRSAPSPLLLCEAPAAFAPLVFPIHKQISAPAFASAAAAGEDDSEGAWWHDDGDDGGDGDGDDDDDDDGTRVGKGGGEGASGGGGTLLPKAFGEFLNTLEVRLLQALSLDSEGEEGGGGLHRLAEEWSEHWDATRQRPYYHHAPSGAVQWQAPTVWHAKALA